MPLAQDNNKSRHAPKSRLGCKRCKQRRVKCNERAPCSNCIRRREKCSLLDTQPSAKRSSISTRHLILDSSTPSSTNEPRPASWVLDLYLMSHFSTDSVYTFSSYPSVVTAWQTTIVSDAVSHPFLLHGMLALSALHLASKPEVPGEKSQQGFTPNDYMRAFRHHQDQAMPAYRSHLQALDFTGNEEFQVRSKQPWPVGPVYATAVLTAFISMANLSDNSASVEPDLDSQVHDQGSSPAPSSASTPGLTQSAKLEAFFDHLMEVFINTRGTRVIVRAGLDTGALLTTPYRHLLTASTIATESTLWSMSPENAEWYDMLRTQCLADLTVRTSRTERGICASAITCLEEVHDAAARLLEFKQERLWHLHRKETLRYDIVWLLKWTAVVSQEFLTLIHERHQAALVILAQFVSICGLCEHQWFLKNWVKNAMAAIRHMLTSGKANAWADRIERRWPVSEPVIILPQPGTWEGEIPVLSQSQL